jgi:hypothetical protein
MIEQPAKGGSPSFAVSNQKRESEKIFGSEWQALMTREVRLEHVGQPTPFSAGVRYGILGVR